MAQNDQALLTRLKDSGLDFVVIGGVCAVFHGSRMAMFVLEICCRFGVENIQRIEAALRDFHPVHRLTLQKLPIEETRNVFGDLKNLYLQTDLGKLDCLGNVAGLGDFDAVVKRSVLAKFSYGEFRFLDLEALIAAKEAAGRNRDLVVVQQLRAIKERLKQKPS
jgi:hypothetical protein